MRIVVLGILTLLCGIRVYAGDLEDRTVYFDPVPHGGVLHKGAQFDMAIILSAAAARGKDADQKALLAHVSLMAFKNIKNFEKRRNIDIGLITGIDVNVRIKTRVSEKTLMDQLLGNEHESVLKEDTKEKVEQRLKWLVDNGMQVNATGDDISPMFTFLGQQNSGDKKDAFRILFKGGGSLANIFTSAQKYFNQQISGYYGFSEEQILNKERVQKDVLARLKVVCDALDIMPKDEGVSFENAVCEVNIREALQDPEKYFPTKEKDAESKKDEASKSKKRE